MSFQGKKFTSEMRALIVNLKESLEKLKQDQQPLIISNVITDVAQLLGIGTATVKRILKDSSIDQTINSKPIRGRPSYVLSEAICEYARLEIRAANLQGQCLSISQLTEKLEKYTSKKIDYSTLRRACQRWGFVWATGKTESLLKETEQILIRRRQYLRKMRRNKNKDGEPIKAEIYLDETYLHENHSGKKSWFEKEQPKVLKRPPGKGRRLIIVDAITHNGWVKGASLCLEAGKEEAGYEGSMNWRNFRKWFEEKLIPNIPNNSLIIMDNAPYHVQAEGGTNLGAKNRKEEFVDALENLGYAASEDMLKSELMKLYKINYPEPVYLVEKLAKMYGHEVVRTPPYHPELQPIELCWGVIKNRIRRLNVSHKLKDVKRLLDEERAKVDKNMIGKMMKEIRKKEDEYWKEDPMIEIKLSNETNI